MYLDLDNCPFYIGKGKGRRYRVNNHLQKDNANNLLKNKIRKVGVANIKIHFLHENITEKESFYWERYWIKYIGRRDLGKGTLCNLTDGGEGNSGMVGKVSPMKGKFHTKESKQKISDAKKGKMVGENSPLYGKSPTKETRQKLREAWKRRKARGDVPWIKDKKHSDIVRKKMAKSHEIFPNAVVREIRGLYKQGIAQQQIADVFNVNQSTISHIVNYKTYKHAE